MVQQAAKLGLAAIGIADRNTLAGVVRAHQAARAYGLRVLVGARLMTTDGFETICYPTDRAAYGRLCRLLTTGNRRAIKGECHFTFEEMLSESEGQIFIGIPPRPLTADFVDRLTALASAAPDRTYLAAIFAYRGNERRRLGELSELAAQARTPLLATTDALYHDPSRRLLADVLTCIREKCTIEQAGYRLETNAERHLKSAAEMTRLFARYPAAITRTLELVRRITFKLDALSYEYPQEPVPPGQTPQAYLEKLTTRHAMLRYPNGVPARVQALIGKKLALIDPLDCARYFLTVYDNVRFAREVLDKSILFLGRCSAANRAVCSCLGMTSVVPTPLALLFYRFISADRREA